ncbi:putative caffeoyl-CoA O-methyltransferase [Drosera capensis]
MVDGKKKMYHLLQNDDLYQYLLDTSVYPREPEVLKELRDATSSHPLAFYGTAPDCGQFLSMLMRLVGAKKTIEVGVFTGYSLLATALTLPEDGKVIGIDINRKSYDVGVPFIKKAGVSHKIEFIESPALLALDNLLEDPKNEGAFDFAFVDADKDNYANYHERLLKLVKVGGLIVYDNTLWGGTVTLPDVSLVFPDSRRRGWVELIELNKLLAKDPRIEISQIPLGDGMTLCKRLE